MRGTNNNYKKLGYYQRSGIMNSMVTETKDWEPFRISDSKMVMGMHKGKSIYDIPKDYIQWMVKQPNLSKTRKSILEKLL